MFVKLLSSIRHMVIELLFTLLCHITQDVSCGWVNRIKLFWFLWFFDFVVLYTLSMVKMFVCLMSSLLWE